jgi:hypothetical protein
VCLLTQKISRLHFVSLEMTKGRGRRQSLARNDEKKFGWNLREKPPQSIQWIDSSPLGGAPKMRCKEITRHGFAMLSSAVRTTAASVTVRACICAHSSHFVKEGCGALCLKLRLTSFVSAFGAATFPNRGRLRAASPRSFGKLRMTKWESALGAE